MFAAGRRSLSLRQLHKPSVQRRISPTPRSSSTEESPSVRRRVTLAPARLDRVSLLTYYLPAKNKRPSSLYTIALRVSRLSHNALRDNWTAFNQTRPLQTARND